MQKGTIVRLGLFLGDLLCTQVALFLTLFLRNKNLTDQFGNFSYHFAFVYCIWILIIYILNLYDLYFFKRPVDFLFNIVIFSVTAFFSSVTYLYFIPEFSSAPKTILILNIVIFAALLVIWRIWTGRLIASHANVPGSYEQTHKKVSLDQISEAWFLENTTAPQNNMYQIVKRALDVLVGVMGLLLFALLFPIIAVIISIDSPGGIFYRQQRVGKNGDIFTITKFRTMRIENSRQQQLWREKDKSNITLFGAILRRAHLDELPQAWSILKGDISFVGPRPEWLEMAKVFEKEIPFYKYRYLVKPGIIGWAQINFPPSQSVEEVKEKFQYDLYYIKNRSLLLDFEIMLKAVKLFLW